MGWMFRVPSKFGMFLSFYFTMILTLGFYGLSLLPLKARLSSLTRYVPTLAFVFCVSIISWPMFTGDFGGLKQDSLEQNTNVVTAGRIPSVSDQLRVLTNNVLVFGGHDKFVILNRSGLIDVKDTGIIFADENIGTLKQNLFPAISNVILTDKEDLMLPLLFNKSVIIAPYDATIHHKPNEVWSKGATE